MIIGGIVFVLYKLKSLLFNYDYIFFNYVKFVGIKNKFINSKFIGIIKKNYYKLFSVIPVIPTSQSESFTENVDNNNINIVKQKLNKITNDINDIIDGVLLQKGGLDNKDVDGIKKIFKKKMENAGIDPNRFIANVNIIKETNDINLSEEDKARLSERLITKTDEMLQRVISKYGNTPKTFEEHKKIIDNANQRLKDLGLDKRIELEYCNIIKNQSESSTNSNISDNITPNNNQSLNTIEELLNFIVLQNENYYTFNLKYLDLIELLNINTDFLSYILLCFIGIIMVLYLLKFKLFRDNK